MTSSVFTNGYTQIVLIYSQVSVILILPENSTFISTKKTEIHTTITDLTKDLTTKSNKVTEAERLNK